ncbi:glycine cleavage system H protein [Crossiella equi]|uniref:Glycine cleavage system H protein n=1 Tax=Crossiella equi TaxID=130796 RepID=A0ABS5ARD1_9PSEU|nr:hypothetical protein [Crossiella equi]MBP2479137.1 glycine cleavage system H protein [Crossiella equi]
MFTDLQTLRYTRDHTWVLDRGDRVRVGLTDLVTRGLSDLTEVGLPLVGSDVHLLAPCGFLATPRWVGDLFAPVSGVVVDRNELLLEDPDLLVLDPYETGWLFEVQGVADVAELMDGTSYLELVSQLG